MCALASDESVRDLTNQRGKASTMRVDQVAWVIIGATTLPVERRSRLKIVPMTGEARTSATPPVSRHRCSARDGGSMR